MPAAVFCGRCPVQLPARCWQFHRTGQRLYRPCGSTGSATGAVRCLLSVLWQQHGMIVGMVMCVVICVVVCSVVHGRSSRPIAPVCFFLFVYFFFFQSVYLLSISSIFYILSSAVCDKSVRGRGKGQQAWNEAEPERQILRGCRDYCAVIGMTKQEQDYKR